MENLRERNDSAESGSSLAQLLKQLGRDRLRKLHLEHELDQMLSASNIVLKSDYSRVRQGLQKVNQRIRQTEQELKVMTAKPPFEGFILLDIETTGIDEKVGYILELGMGHFDLDFNLLDVFTTLVITSETMEFIEDAWNKNDVAYQMHDKSGLLGEIDSLHKSDLSELHPDMVMDRSTEWLRSVGVHSEDKQPWTGSSVHFDKTWMGLHFPAIAENYFTYRTIDASGIRELVRKRRPDIAELVDHDTKDARKEHRVLPDILDTADLFIALKKHGAIL